MRKLLFVLIAFSLTSLIFAQNKTCCNTKTDLSFASFSEDGEFRDAHQLPNDYSHQNAMGEMISYNTPDGKKASAYFIKSESKSDKFIFVIHEWWGLNDNIKKEADELKNNLGDVNILALDMYDGKLATTREDAAKFMQSVDAERAKNIIMGAINFAGEDAKVATIGWCFGGGWSLQTSIWLKDKGVACVMYYGIIENTPETFKDLQAPVLGIFAEKDGWVTPEVYGNLEKNIKAAGKEINLYSFDADHAFANPSNSNFDKQSTDKAKELTLDFFKKNLVK